MKTKEGRSYRTVGRTKDGVVILRQPVTKPRNITLAQARRAVRKYRESLTKSTD